jgi:hypothetical protein
MPKCFPGVNGCPTDGVPPFVCLDGLPPDWLHLVVLSKPLSRAIHAASQLPTVPDEETRRAQFEQLALARQAALNVATTIERITEWSKANLEPNPSQPTKMKSRAS